MPSVVEYTNFPVVHRFSSLVGSGAVHGSTFDGACGHALHAGGSPEASLLPASGPAPPSVVGAKLHPTSDSTIRRAS